MISVSSASAKVAGKLDDGARGARLCFRRVIGGPYILRGNIRDLARPPQVFLAAWRGPK
jgi:hypothetical protein